MNMQYPPQPQYPGYPPQQVPQQFTPQPAYAPPIPQQGYAPPAPQPPAQPLAAGSLDAFYSQPSAGGGPSISWTNADRSPKPIGTAYSGIVARDVTNADIQQQTDFNTKQPLFYRDGRPKFAMKVPLKVQPSQEFPDGEATWYVKGQARDELVRAMAEAGVESGAPRAGAAIQITLVQRKPSGQGLNPSNVVQVRYIPPQGTGAPSPAPVPEPVSQPVQQQVQQIPQQPVAQPIAQAQPQYAPQPQGQVFATVDQAAAPQVQQQAPAPAQPAAPQGGLQPPADFNAEQQALLARLTGGQG